MKVYTTRCTDPALNLAAEERLMQEPGDIFFLWQNAPVIVIGRNQNAYREINLDYVKEHGIAVVRRNTGGGAVFHDLGNYNFSFITDALPDSALNFERFTRPIVDYLKSLGLPAAFSGRNDIALDGKKISGNAQCVIGGRFLSHGTLLYQVRMSDLTAALRPDPLKIQSKGIESVRARVTNICEYLPDAPPVSEFAAGLAQFVAAQSGVEPREIDPAADPETAALAEKKYRSWEWVFGENPEYSFKKTAKYPGGILEIGMEISGERIEKLSINGDFLATEDIAPLRAALLGQPHREEDLRRAIAGLELSRYLGTITADELIATLF